MLRNFAAIIGVILLLLGLAFLFSAWGPNLSNEALELGGSLISQEELFDQTFGTVFDETNLPDLPVNVDGDELSTNVIGAVPELSQAVLEDVSTVDQPESDAVSALQVDAADEVVSEDVSVELVPLELSSAVTGTVDTSGSGGATSVGGLAQRVVQFEYPKNFRLGRSENVRLTLKPVGNGQLAVVPELEDNALISTPILISDYHDTHYAVFSARLLAPDVQAVTLITSETQQIERNEEATWRWSIKVPENSGKFTMTLILNLRWEPKPGSAMGTIDRGTIWSQSVEANVEYVFGILSVPQASLLGTALAVFGFISTTPTLATLLGYFGLSRFTGRPKRRRTSTRRSSSRRR